MTPAHLLVIGTTKERSDKRECNFEERKDLGNNTRDRNTNSKKMLLPKERENKQTDWT